MKRLNVKLVLGLVLGTIVVVAGTFVIHRFQIRSTSHQLLEEGRRLYAEGLELKKDAAKKAETYVILEDAAEMLAFHLQLTPESEEAADEHVLIWNETIPLAGNASQLRMSLLSTQNSGESALVNFPQKTHTKVREILVDLYMSPFFSAYGQANTHLDKLLESDANNKELLLKKARCLASLTENDDAAKMLQTAIKADPHQIDSYLLLAAILRDRKLQPEAAERVMDDMVSANPDAYRAFLTRANFHLHNPAKLEQVRLDTNKAAELAPDEIDVIMTKIKLAEKADEPSADEIAQLRRMVDAALKENDKDERLYWAVWRIAQMERNPEEALRVLEEGAKQLPDSPMLLQLLADQYFSANQIDKVRDKVKELEKRKNVKTENLKFIQACVDMADRKWEDAVAKFTEVRPLMPANITPIDLRLGQLYRILDRPNEAKVVYERVVAQDPKSVPGRAGIAYAEHRLGRPAEAIRILKEIKNELGVERFAKNAELRNLYVQLETDAIQALPEGQRDWTVLNEIVSAAKPEGNQAVGNTMTAQIQVLLGQGRVAEAKQLIEEVLKTETKNASLWAVLAQIVADEPDGTRRALELVRAKSAELNQPLPLRVLEIALVSQGSDKDQVAADLLKLAEGTETLRPAEQERIYRDLGAALQRANRLPEALVYWRKARKVQPSDSNILMQMYTAVRAAADDAMMQEVIQEIRQRFGADSEELLVAEASRIITLVDAKKLPKDQLSDAQTKLKDLQGRNSRSGPLARLQGDIARIEGDTSRSIEFLRQAVERGERDPVMMATLAHLLAIRGQQKEADELLERLKAAGYNSYYERVRNVQQATQGNFDGLIDVLEQHLQKDSSDLAKWLDLVTVLRQAGRNAVAEERLREAVNKFPDDERGWVALVAHLVSTNQRAVAEAALEEARRTVPKDKLLATMAMSREKLGPPGQAAKEYDLWLAASPDDLHALQAASAFQLDQAQADPANAETHLDAAKKLLDRMIAKAAAVSKEDQSYVSWARARKAQALASTRRHRDFQEAIKLLDANATAGGDSTSDRLLRARMFALRQEKVYQREGSRLLQQLRQQDLLSPTEQLGLVQLLSQLGEWSQARTMLSELVDTQEDKTLPAALMVKLLIDHNEVQQCSTYVDVLMKINPQSQQAVLSKARVQIASGKAEEGVKLLKSLVPRPLPPGQEKYLYAVAQLLDELKQTDAAEELYREFYAARPASILSFAEFRARHGRTDAALDLCASAMAKGFAPSQVVHVGNGALRQAKPAATAEQSKRVESWIDQGLASSPGDTLTLKLMRAELYDLQGKYDEVERIYRETLAEKDLSDAQRALIGNNLGYLLAMRGKDAGGLDDALAMVNEAIDILGPTSDLLDTRAMVHLARKDSREAIKDLEVAISEEPSGSKLFHLALAQMDAGLNENAKATYQKARDDYGLNPSDLSALEGQEFDRLKTGLGL